MRDFSILFILLIFIILPANAQSENTTGTEQEISIIQQIGSRYSRCDGIKNKVVDEQAFKEITKDNKCPLAKNLKVDFAKHTLISYRVGGDCFIEAEAEVFRNDAAKTYHVVINNYWGRCRAGGSFQGWLVIAKIPANYQVEFEVKLLEDKPQKQNNNSFSLLPSSTTTKPDIEFIGLDEADLKGCVQMYRQKEFVIKDKEDYLKNIRRDAQKQACIEKAETLEFEKYSYVGLEINSGYCRRPEGLEYNIAKDAEKKQYILNVSYIDPQGQVCRALSRYDLWFRVPKLPEEYEVIFEVEPRSRNN
jgi:hypothetical protein